jgi:plasmid stabilization system protein ParE
VLQVHFDPEAVAELTNALDWYSARSERAARSFALELERVMRRLSDDPMRCSIYRHGTRQILLRRFPYAVIYRVVGEEVQVIAVAHQHRRPGYWRTRRHG